jgi:hypothetical protein
MNFEPITLERQKEYQERLHGCPQLTSAYRFADLWGGVEEYNLVF